MGGVFKMDVFCLKGKGQNHMNIEYIHIKLRKQ